MTLWKVKALHGTPTSARRIHMITHIERIRDFFSKISRWKHARVYSSQVMINGNANVRVQAHASTMDSKAWFCTFFVSWLHANTHFCRWNTVVGSSLCWCNWAVNYDGRLVLKYDGLLVFVLLLQCFKQWRMLASWQDVLLRQTWLRWIIPSLTGIPSADKVFNSDGLDQGKSCPRRRVCCLLENSNSDGLKQGKSFPHRQACGFPTTCVESNLPRNFDHNEICIRRGHISPSVESDVQRLHWSFGGEWFPETAPALPILQDTLSLGTN